MALLSFVESAPRAYRLKASNAAPPFFNIRRDIGQNAGSSVSALTLPTPQVASGMKAVLPFMIALALPIDLAWKYLCRRALASHRVR
jgi:hypothetical protein